jgi:hypothetical protein
MNKNPVDWAAASRAPDPCLVCGSLAKEPLYPSTYIGSVAEAPAYFLAHRSATAHAPIVRCLDCCFVFTSPRFAAQDYDQIYKAVRLPPSLDPPSEAAKASRFRRLATIVRGSTPARPLFSISAAVTVAFSANSTAAQGAALKSVHQGDEW